MSRAINFFCKLVYLGISPHSFRVDIRQFAERNRVFVESGVWAVKHFMPLLRQRSKEERKQRNKNSNN